MEGVPEGEVIVNVPSAGLLTEITIVTLSPIRYVGLSVVIVTRIGGPTGVTVSVDRGLVFVSAGVDVDVALT
jgi:hypothetical protein